MTTLPINGFHGTSLESAQSILKSAYKESNKANEWLGHGVYFFVDGVSDPLENAKEWARAQGRDKYKEYAVLRSEIDVNPDRLIDLTDVDGIRAFNDIKDALIDKIFDKFHIKTLKPNQHNCRLFNFTVALVKAEAVKHHLYIKSIKERKLKLRLNVPNTTVLCVTHPHCLKDSAQVFEGEII